MSTSRRRLVLAIAAIIIIGQAVDTVAQREHFPFSNYPMYAHETGPTTSLLRLYGIVTDGKRIWETPIADSNSFVFVPEMNEMRMKNVLAFSYGKGQAKNIAATRRVLRDYLNVYERQRIFHSSNAPQMLAAECKRLTWTVAADGMPDPTPQIQTLVTFFRISAHDIAMNVRAAIYRFFFAPSDALSLGICRCLFFALLLWQYGRFDFAAYGNFPASFRNPIWVFEFFHLPFVSHKSMTILGAAFKLSLLLMTIGWWTRPISWVAAIAGSYVLAVPNNFGRAGHGDDVVVVVLWIFALAHSGDEFSVDHFFATRRGAVLPPASGEYTWPIRMVWLLMSLVYFAAGVTKLRVSGLHWALSDNMAFTLRAHEVNNSHPMLHLGVAIARHAWIVRSLALTTLVLETFFFLSLFNRWAKIVLVPAMFLGHIFIALVMGVVFTQFMFTYLFWLPWRKMLTPTPGQSVPAPPGFFRRSIAGAARVRSAPA